MWVGGKLTYSFIPATTNWREMGRWVKAECNKDHSEGPAGRKETTRQLKLGKSSLNFKDGSQQCRGDRRSLAHSFPPPPKSKAVLSHQGIENKVFYYLHFIGKNTIAPDPLFKPLSVPNTLDHSV